MKGKDREMKTYHVTIPIAGNTWAEVEAETEKEAIEKALESKELEGNAEWEALSKIHDGNVCYCPIPWEIEVEEV
jgi:hypothetical protein